MKLVVILFIIIKNKIILKSNVRRVPWEIVNKHKMAEQHQLPEDDKTRLKAARERSNKISKLMGNYLLKGYKMLGTTCNKCQTILVQDRQGENYCIGCVEVDATVTPSENPPNKMQPPPTGSGNILLSSKADFFTKCNTSSLDNIYAQIDLVNKQFQSVVTLNDRTNLISVLKLCYETLELIKK